MKTKIYNLIILDASGSMYSIEKQAVDGANETVQTIREAQKKHEDQEHYVTLISFNSSETKKIYDCEAAAGVKELSAEEYRPNCNTPLYDAMGFSITELQKKVEFMSDDQCFCTVTADDIDWESLEPLDEKCKQRARGLDIQFPTIIGYFKNGVAEVRWQF